MPTAASGAKPEARDLASELPLSAASSHPNLNGKSTTDDALQTFVAASLG